MVKKALWIHKHDIHRLQGSTKSSAPSPDQTTFEPRMAISDDQKFQQIQVDLMFLNGDAYLIILVYPMRYIIAQHILGKSTIIIRQALLKHVDVIKAHGFIITDLITDGEGAISALSNHLNVLGIDTHRLGTGDHAAKVERTIQFIKERARSIYQSLPYRLPVILQPTLVAHVTRLINFIPRKGQNISPYVQLTGRKPNWQTQIRHRYGEYVLLHPPSTSNNMTSRATHGILLHSSGNAYGSVFALNLETGGITLRRAWTSLPIPANIITHMNNLADNKKTPPLKSAADSSKRALKQHEPELPQELQQVAPPPPPLPVTVDDIRGPNVVHPSQPLALPDTTGLSLPSSTPSEAPIDPTAAQQVNCRGVCQQQEDTFKPPRKYREPISVIQARRDKARNQSDDDYQPSSKAKKVSTWVATSHITFKAAMKSRPTESKAAATAEIKQLLDRKVFHGIQPSNMTQEQRKNIITSSLFFRDKYNPDGSFEKYKARLVAGGHRQDRSLYDDLSSPTVATQALLMVASIAATENRHVATLDISGAYLNAPIGTHRVFMSIDKDLADIVVEVDPSYSTFIQDNGKLVVELDKALYGCVESAKLWNSTLHKLLTEMGFKANPYDQCTYNGIWEQKQVTICVHVDDFFITSISLAAIDHITDIFEEKFPGCNIKKNRRLFYTGMTMDFESEPGHVLVSQEKFIEDLLESVDSDKVYSSPATANLFVTQENQASHSAEDSRVPPDVVTKFHSEVAKLLYLAKRTRPDILTTVSFLATRVQNPDSHDISKLNRVLGYLKSTSDYKLRLNANFKQVVAHVDASFAVHANAVSHTGVVITLGSGAVFAKSTKQRLVTKSSTEAELVGLSDGLSQIIWSRNFLQAQGFSNEPAIVYQDNKSAMLLANKGTSASERSRHINIRYFFIKDKIDSGEVTIKYMSTSQIISDGLTKPLHGAAFSSFTRGILGRK